MFDSVRAHPRSFLLLVFHTRRTIETPVRGTALSVEGRARGPCAHPLGRARPWYNRGLHFDARGHADAARVRADGQMRRDILRRGLKRLPGNAIIWQVVTERREVHWESGGRLREARAVEVIR